MTDLKQKIEEVLETEPYCEYGKVINKSHVSDLILKLIEENYIPKKKGNILNVEGTDSQDYKGVNFNSYQTKVCDCKLKDLYTCKFTCHGHCKL